MTHETHDMGKVWRIYLRISRFPILATTIRERMRHELFMRGIVDPKRFEEEVKEEAIESQQREGLHEPLHRRAVRHLGAPAEHHPRSADGLLLRLQFPSEPLR